MARSKVTLCALAFLTFVRIGLADAPAGFEDPKVLDAVKAGTIHVEKVIQTKKEFRTIFRAFFNKVSPDAYVGISTDHAKYPSMFPEIQEAKTTKVNADKTELSWWMKVNVQVGIFPYTIYPEGIQRIQRGPDAVSETKILNEITNYKDMIKSGLQTTRLIPYEGGILIHDDIHFTLQKDNAQSSMIQNHLQNQFKRYIETFKEELKGY